MYVEVGACPYAQVVGLLNEMKRHENTLKRAIELGNRVYLRHVAVTRGSDMAMIRGSDTWQ